MPIPRAFVGIYHDMDTVENMLDAIQVCDVRISKNTID